MALHLEVPCRSGESACAGILNAVMDALEAHTTMSQQALDSQKVRKGLKHVLLDRRLYESLRDTPE